LNFKLEKEEKFSYKKPEEKYKMEGGIFNYRIDRDVSLENFYNFRDNDYDSSVTNTEENVIVKNTNIRFKSPMRTKNAPNKHLLTFDQFITEE